MRISEEQRGMTRPEKDRYGGIAQLGEHLLCKQGVSGSIPLISTKTVISYKKSVIRNYDRKNNK